jgi:hypothetical protein
VRTPQFFSCQPKSPSDAPYRVEHLQDKLRCLLEEHSQKVKDSDDHQADLWQCLGKACEVDPVHHGFSLSNKWLNPLRN